MLKCSPKSMKIGPKIDLEPTLGSKILLLEAFGAMQKYHRFLVPFLRPKNRGKLAQNAARRRPPFPESSAMGRFGVPWAPGRPRARPETRYKKQESRPKGLKAIGKKESWLFRKGNKAILRDLTPKGQGPGEFVGFIFLCIF